MRSVFVMVSLVACAGTSRVCPPETRLATEDGPGGRIEWCARTMAGLAAVPAQREYPDVLGTAAPATMRAGLHGPYTRWYPNGAIEVHGRYVEAGTTSVPDGVWATWHPDGSRKSVGRYDRGQPTGCFAMWDARGNGITGIVERDQWRDELCEPPVDAALLAAEQRSRPSGAQRWGDFSFVGSLQAGAHGSRNATQREPDPSARAQFQLTIRKHVGHVRVGPMLAYRMSDGDDSRAYTGGVSAAFAVPVFRRVDAEVGAQLGIEYLELTARRMDFTGSGGSHGFWAPVGRVHGALAFAVTRSVQLVAGASVGGAPSRDETRNVRYCNPVCTVPIVETWSIGGVSYGVDLGARILLR